MIPLHVDSGPDIHSYRLKKSAILMVQGRALKDWTERKVFNGYEPGTFEHLVYQEKIDRLKEISRQ